MFVVAALITATLVYVLPPYLTFDPRTSRAIVTPNFPAHYALILVHVFTATVAWVTGVFQIWPWLLRRHRTVHRFSGRIYVFAGALPTAVVAIVLRVVADHRDGTVLPGSLGLIVAAAVWFTTTVIGYRRVRQGRYADHRRWMTYSYAIALTNLWNRPVALLTVAYVPGVLPAALEVVGWLPFIVHLGVAHWWVTRRKSSVLESRSFRTVPKPATSVST